MIATRRALLGGLVLLPLLPSARARAEQPADREALETALDEVFAVTAPPALGAAVVGAGGLAWSAVRGVRRAGHPEPVTLEDRWHLGSNTKAMTAAVFARLVDQGAARWGMPLREAFPALTIDPAWADTTLDDLMHHRAGLLDAAVIGREWLMTARADPRSLREQRAAIAALALSGPPTGTPGEFAYGNANYIVVGAAIEAITGVSWEESMQGQLFDPLGLASAGFGAPSAPNAWGHRAFGDQSVPIDPVSPGADNPLALGPAGTVHMNLDDYGRFLAAAMGAAPEWLGPESLAILTTPPAGPAPAYAMGWGVSGQPWAGADGPGTVLAHEGSNTMWHAAAMLAPQRRLGFVAVSNDAAAGRQACQRLVRRLVAAYASAPAAA